MAVALLALVASFNFRSVSDIDCSFLSRIHTAYMWAVYAYRIPVKTIIYTKLPV